MNRRGFLGGAIALLGFRGPVGLLEGPATVRGANALFFLGIDHGAPASAGHVLLAMTPLGEVWWVQQFMDGPPTLQEFLTAKGSYAAKAFDTLLAR